MKLLTPRPTSHYFYQTIFQEANKTLEDTRANVTGTLSSWGGWASSLAKTVTEKIDDEITKIATADTTPKLTGEGDDSDLGISTV